MSFILLTGNHIPTMNMLSDYFSVINLENNLGFKKLSNIQTICDVFNVQSVEKIIFHEYYTLLQLYLQVPLITATTQRSFSAMNKIKTYLRSIMTEQRFNYVVIPRIHKEKLG